MKEQPLQGYTMLTGRFHFRGSVKKRPNQKLILDSSVSILN